MIRFALLDATIFHPGALVKELTFEEGRRRRDSSIGKVQVGTA